MAKQFQSVQEALAHYDKRQNEDHVRKAEEERQEMQQRFPLEAWPTMSLEQYALGQPNSSETYSYWLEFGTPHMGSMRGGSSVKHLVYKHKRKPGWYYRPQYSNEREAWQDLRAAFVRMFELAQEGRWEEISEVEALSGGRMLKLKSLHLYFPDDILPITSIYHLQHFLQHLGITEDEMKNWGAVTLNRYLLQTMRQIPQLQAWSTKEIERFLYTWADPRQARHVIKIAPGERARHWDDCLANGYICVGWDKTGDLREFESEEEFRDRFFDEYAETYNNRKSTVSKKAKEVWTLTALEPGDLIIANQGLSRVLAVGEVVEPGYEWRPDRDEYKHTARVNWDTSYAKDIELPKHWATVTVAPVGLELSQRLLTRGDRPQEITVPLPSLYPEIAVALERRGQLILYGPPGTGKTFHARRFAVWWLGQQQEDANATVPVNTEQLLEAEQQLKSRGALTWVTFHPSYSYEDFIEGFRPVDTSEGGLVLKMEDGLFKRICREAQANPQKDYLLIVDEINRANLAKVFGEIITLLEKDKRGLVITLPQSKESFTVPANVYLLGTMNTADRSIKLMDTALRRRFAFMEIMPDVSLLVGATINTLPLDEFLTTLNRRIAETEGREKQIGHAYLLDGEQPISEPEEFSRRFCQEILPLLQEYCYDDYAELAHYLGEQLVNTRERSLNMDVLTDPDRLIEALTAMINEGAVA